MNSNDSPPPSGSKSINEIAHRLRTPLTVIMAAVNNLLDGAFGPLNDQQRTWLEKLQGHTTALEQILNEILEAMKDRAEQGGYVARNANSPTPVASTKIASSPSQPGGDIATILVVDDQADVLDVMQDGLSGQGFHILTATNGEDAFRLASESRPDLILMDVHLAGQNGIEVCSRIKKALNRFTPVILVTGQGDLREMTGSDAADDLLMKPFQIQELFVRVRSMLRMKKLMDAAGGL